MGKPFNNIIPALFIVMLIMFSASLCLNVHHYTGRTAEPYRDTIRTTFVDTIPYYKPVPKDSTVIKYVTVRVPVADDKEDNFPIKSVPKITETHQKTPDFVLNSQDSLGNYGKSVPKDHFEDMGEMATPDSVNVVLPITQKIYEEDTYTAFVSGYNPSLDSLIFKMPREVVTIKECSKPKRWSVGVQVGYGVTLKGEPQFAPYVGVGVSYNLFSF